jgi:hypothetical protein
VRKTQCFDLRPLGERARLELAYARQSRHDAVSARAARRWPGP